MAPYSLPEVKQDRLTDTVYRVLRESILQRRFKSGERLNVEELAEQLNVSRTPVRESLNLLAAEGLVEIVQRSGTFVTRISVKDVEECFDLRRVLEGYAAELVASRPLDPEQLQRLHELAAWTFDPHSDVDETIQHAEANRRFHELLIELTGSKKFIQIYRMLNASTMMALIHYASPQWHERRVLERQEHEAIVAALEKGDAEGAKHTIEAHITRAKHSLIADMQRAIADGSMQES